MNKESGFEIAEAVIVLAIIAILISIPYVSNAECTAKASRIGFAYEWTFFGGCMIEERKGAWIPLGNYRRIAD